MAIIKTDVYDVQVGQPIDLRFSKTDIGARDNIPIITRYAGLIVYTRNENAFWMWPVGATTNDDWVQLDVIGGVTPRVWFSEDLPASNIGNDGDIYFFESPSGISVYQKIAGDWGSELGIFPKGSAVTLDNDVAFGTTSSDLDAKYPDSQPGDIVWSDTGQIVFTKLGPNAWDYKSLSIA